MSRLEDRVGRYVVDRISDKLLDVVRDAVGHGISPTDVVAILREAWSIHLHDKKKWDDEEFQRLGVTR